MVGLAVAGFGVLGVMWRSLDRRMDRLGARIDRRRGVGNSREVLGLLVSQFRQLGRIEGHLGIAPEAASAPPQGPEAVAV